MHYRPLSDTGLKVSALCLGTMTFGEQNTEQEAFAQLDAALDAGINFIDTAEMYSVPPRAETMGRTETIIGNWLKARQCRDKVIIATKVAGPGRDWVPYIRGGHNRLDAGNIQAAVDGSLQRLRRMSLICISCTGPIVARTTSANSVTSMSRKTMRYPCWRPSRHSDDWWPPARCGISVSPMRRPGD